MTLRFTADDIRAAVGAVVYDRGRRYQSSGAVTVKEVSGTVILGTVEGSRAKPYKVRASIASRNGQTRLSGVCSCPVGTNCKHVAALLLEVLLGQATTPAADDSVPASLSLAVSSWLTGLGQAVGPADSSYPPGVRQRLYYILTEQARLETVVARLRKGGDLGEVRPYAAVAAVFGTSSRFLLPVDRSILRTLHAYSEDHGGNEYPIRDQPELLQRILATGRCHWQDVEGPVLAAGPERPGRFSWHLGMDAMLRPELTVDGDAVVLPLQPPHYVDAVAGQCGPVASGLPPALASHLLQAPAVPAREAGLVRARMAELLPERDDLLPPHLPPPRRSNGPLRPRLWLHQREVEVMDEREEVTLPLARLSFLYGEAELADNDHRDAAATIAQGNELIVVRRNLPLEEHYVDRLNALGFARLRNHRGFLPTPDCRDDRLLLGGRRREDFEAFLLKDVPRLREDGWVVDVDDSLRDRTVEPDGPLEFAVGEAPEGNDWFDLSLGTMVDGQRVDLLPALLALLRRPGAADTLASRPLSLELEDGRLLVVKGELLLPMAQALLELYGEVPAADGPLRLNRREAADLAMLEAATPAAVWQGGEAVRDMGRRLRDHQGIPAVAVPPAFRGTLRGYQQDGLNWLQFLRSVGLGGILADDMGLGKTVQILAHLSEERAAGRLDLPCLVVAPTSLMPNWRREAAAFAPDFRVLVLHGSDRRDRYDDLGEWDLVLTTYALVARDVETLAAQPWAAVIADEAQFVKNPDTQAARALRRLEARHRLCLTGTPVENHLGELWSLFDFVSPGLLGDRGGFARHWRNAIEKKGDDEARLRLARRVRPFLLRRTKGQVAADLPPKTEILESIEMAEAQRGLYESIRLAMHEKVRAAIAAKGLARSRIDFLDALLKLRQACCDPRLVKTPTARKVKGSAKLERLMEMLPELAEEGRRVLVFSQFTSMLDLIEPELKKAGLDFVRLSGETRDRDAPVRRFQAGEVPVFLISLKAGGTGLNLTAADTVIHYDPWWNPAVEAQATDRAHRIGQNKAVFVHKLIVQGTVEEKILALQSRKAALAAAVFDPKAAGPLALSDEDVEFLLGEG